MSQLPAVLEALSGYLSPDPEDPSVWRGRLHARPEPGNDRKQDLEVHVVQPDRWHEGLVIRSTAAAVPNELALRVLSKFRDPYGTLEYQAADDHSGYLSLVAHVPLLPFTLSDPQALINFLMEFIGHADQLEEALHGGTDNW